MSPSGLPFLYMTRTILRVPRSRPSTTALRALHTTPHRHRATSEIPFEHELAEEDIPLEQDSSSRSPPPPRGTITPTERQVFERIFADIRARGLQPSIREDADAEPASKTAGRSAMLIMQQAAYDVGQSRSSAIAAPALLAGAARDRSKALLRFPPELRAAASRALNAFNPEEPRTSTARAGNLGSEEGVAGETEEDEGWKSPAASFMRTIEVEAKRLPERQRVERAITEAKTDHELWAVLEREVFTFPARFGLASTPEPVPTLAAPKPKGRKTKKQIQAEAAALAQSETDTISTETPEASLDSDKIPIDDVNLDNDDTSSPEAPPPVSSERMSLYIYGPLYPAYLLLALRRLDTAFRLPSPYVFNLLPRIKELGLESYVLGISTPLYNELLDIHWRRRGDLQGMLALLEEMRHCGLYFDEQTSSILATVGRESQQLSRGGYLPRNRTRGDNDGDDASSGAAAAAAGSTSSGGGSARRRDTDNRTGGVATGGFAAAVMNMPEYEQSVRDRLKHWQRGVDISIAERRGDFSNAPVS